MNIVLLTTETAHHAYFAWQVAAQFPFKRIFVETCAAEPPFETAHPFERDVAAFERETLLKDGPAQLRDVCDVTLVRSMNDIESIRSLKREAPDVILSFGTGRLDPYVINAAQVAALNLHGGPPEDYRGLDTHLWAIYHGDFDNLVTTLHFLDEGLDTGDIVFQDGIPLDKGMPLYRLRARNTEICVKLSLLALQCLSAGRPLPRRRQLRRGRYYSFMPADLKNICVERFKKHTDSL